MLCFDGIFFCYLKSTNKQTICNKIIYYSYDPPTNDRYTLPALLLVFIIFFSNIILYDDKSRVFNLKNK